MVNVYSRSSALCVYRSSTCSSATLFLIVLYGSVLILPAIIVHNSYGLWRSLETFSEQPKIDFKKDYLLIVDTVNDSSIFWGNSQNQGRPLNTPSLLRITHSRADTNLDLKAEHHDFRIDIDTANVTGVRFLIRMEARLQKMAGVLCDCLIYVEHNSGIPGKSLTVTADVRLQESLIFPFKSYNDFRTDLDLTQPIEDILTKYSKSKAKCVLDAVTKAWRPSRKAKEFTLSVALSTGEQAFHFRPGLAYLLKFAWIQYFSILAVFGGFALRLKKYVFENQIIETYCVDTKML